MLRKKGLLTAYFVAALVAMSALLVQPAQGTVSLDDEGYTYQEWDFSEPDNHTPAPIQDTLYNPYINEGNPLLINVDTDHSWYQSVDNQAGVWALGEIDIIIPNRPVIDGYKEMYIDLVWKPLDGLDINPNPFLPNFPNIGITPFLDDPSQSYEVQKFLYSDEVDEDGWHRSLYAAYIWPNPYKEYISIKGNILVDHLAIETYCVPEPTTIALIGAGALMTLRRRKHKKQSNKA